MVRNSRFEKKTKHLLAKIIQNLQPGDVPSQMIRYNLLYNTKNTEVNTKNVCLKRLETSRGKWNFINEAKNLLQIFETRQIQRQKTSTRMKPTSMKSTNWNQSIQFQLISLNTFKKHFEELTSNKLLNPSNIPTWALKDCANIIFERL